MKKMIKNFKRLKQLFGIYEIGNEYMVRLKDIKINPDFENSPPRFKKMHGKWDYYREYGEFESKIILNRDFELVDGYTSYIIAEKEGINKVPVYFVD